jgi:hypothetical protein
MKKAFATTFCALMFFSLLLLTVGAAMAAEPGYERISYPTQVIPTIDGMWTTEDEWTDGEVTWIGTDVAFRSTYDVEMTRWIVEFFSDTTDDAGDMWRFCYHPDPSIDISYKFEISGHDDIKWYLGVGGGWTELGGAMMSWEWANSFSASPTNSTPHWILEFQRLKDVDEASATLADVWNFYLETFDASNPGFHAWPPTDPDDPEQWGVENYSTEPIPEGLTFGIMVLLSTVSVVVGYKYFVKRKETKTQ